MPRVADQAVAGGKGFIVEGRIEQRAREVSPERTADLHRPHRTSGEGAAGDIVDEFAERDAEGGFEQAAKFDVAGKLDRHSAAGSAHAEIGVGLGAAGEDERDCRERQYVVDDGGLAEQALVRRQRRLGADDAAPALEAFEQRGLFTADIGAGADAYFEIEIVLRSADAFAEVAGAPAGGDRGVHRLDRMRIFRADVDVALGGADGDAGDRHAFDQLRRDRLP